jgi:uncharacterized membrane protein YidH (DUF202 family)
MIQHYSDHAANERTFLAWVRVMGFGFLIVKFDIFLATMAAGTSSSRPVLHGQKFAACCRVASSPFEVTRGQRHDDEP